jgi:hypothetical protein
MVGQSRRQPPRDRNALGLGASGVTAFAQRRHRRGLRDHRAAHSKSRHLSHTRNNRARHLVPEAGNPHEDASDGERQGRRQE